MSREIALAVLVSGEGTTLDALAEAISGRHVPARIVLVVSDRAHAPAIERARRRGLPTEVLPYHGRDPDEWGLRLAHQLGEHGAELVLLAGFLPMLPRPLLLRYRGRIVNVHPSLLPKHGGRGMFGRHVHEAVLAAGDPETGVSVHLVTEELDAGPVLWQERVPVESSDTPDVLRERLRPLELRGITEVLTQFADGRLPLPYAPPQPTDSARRPGDAAP